MDWNRHETYKHLSVQQLQLKLDEINRERKTVPVFKNDNLDINSLYTIEVWFHFRSNMQMAIIYKDIIEEVKDTICYVACPLRYSAALQYVKQNIDFSKSFSVRAISSSYLPDWRPGQDYRKCYSAHRDMGGGVGIDLIHEWDYLTWLFGTPVETYSIQRKISNLEIDSDDVAIYIGRTSSTSIELHLDYFGRSMIRTLEMFLPDDTIRCDIEDGRIEYLRTGKVIQLPSERNEYQMREIEHFFEIINNKIENDSTMEHAFHVLKLAKGE